MTLVVVDILGTKHRWQTSGVAGVTASFEVFRDLVRTALNAVGPDAVAEGNIQSDGLAMVFHQPLDAVRFGRALFRAAWNAQSEDAVSRFWLRGVAIETKSDGPLMAPVRMSAKYSTVSVLEFSDDLLRAINLEQAGTKGARFLIDARMVDQAMKDALAIKIGASWLIPLTTLRYSNYPKRAPWDPEPASAEPPSGENVEPYFRDLLWMVPDELGHWDEWEMLSRQVDQRFLWAQQNEGEAQQVAATALVFKQVEAILGAIGKSLPGRVKLRDARL